MGFRERYKLGAGTVGQIEEWTISTPAQQQARLDQVRAAVRSLAVDVSRYAPPDAQAAPAWSQWAVQFSNWLQAFERFQPDWSDRLWGNTATQIESYAGQLDGWRKAFAQWPGAQITGPGAGVATDQQPPKKGMHPLAIAAIGAAGALTLVGVALAFRGGGSK